MANSYDSADRLLTTGYSYDAFGRTTATGTGSVNAYWANDLVESQTAGDTPPVPDPRSRPALRGLHDREEADGRHLGQRHQQAQPLR
ncbi:hypothetical protein ACFY3J_04060 [Streptomyces sp. NPDC001231]|uniref:hypothetical protein n=1 Tax=unclassified Streptomyces TaxID=2593676 RepID=UPI0036D100C9